MSLKTALEIAPTRLWVLLIPVLFVACNPILGDQQGELISNEVMAAAITGVAWAERVEFRDPIVPAPPGGVPNVNLRVTINNGLPIPTPVIFQATGRIVFDLPAPPTLPGLPAGLPSTISGDSYYQTPTPSQQATYTNRGRVKVQMLNSANQVVRQWEYTPYGAVKPGELTVLAESSNGQCFSLPVGFTVVNSLLVQIGTASVCYITTGFSNKGTQEAINQLTALGLSVDKNTVSSLDQTGANAFDPTCDQIARWLNPIGSNFPTTDMTQLATYVNSQAATVTGAGVKVYVVGGGFGANDGFSCPLANFEGHDQHVGDIIRSLAPGANIEAKEVCSDLGNCLSSDIVRALLEIADEAETSSDDMVVNMSLGGPLRNQAMFLALQYMQDRVLVVTSGGNGFAAPKHYPASFSSRLPNPGLLTNVISVAASGVSSAGAWGVAGFNTRANASLFAPGINLCPNSILTFRCKNSLPFSLDDLGATGSSFAAPVVAAIAALYLDNALPQQNLTPLRLGQCLMSYSRGNPLLDRMIYFDPAGC